MVNYGFGFDFDHRFVILLVTIAVFYLSGTSVALHPVIVTHNYAEGDGDTTISSLSHINLFIMNTDFYTKYRSVVLKSVIMNYNNKIQQLQQH
jgi:hypothetical protein